MMRKKDYNDQINVKKCAIKVLMKKKTIKQIWSSQRQMINYQIIVIWNEEKKKEKKNVDQSHRREVTLTLNPTMSGKKQNKTKKKRDRPVLTKDVPINIVMANKTKSVKAFQVNNWARHVSGWMKNGILFLRRSGSAPKKRPEKLIGQSRKDKRK